MLVIMHAKFEVNRFCGLDFRQGWGGGGGGAQTLPWTPHAHNRVKM